MKKCQMEDSNTLLAFSLAWTHKSPINAENLDLKALQNKFLKRLMNFVGLSGGVAVPYTCGRFTQWMQVC
jgi:hypothetical protein